VQIFVENDESGREALENVVGGCSTARAARARKSLERAR
jgi:hypothetical protein